MNLQDRRTDEGLQLAVPVALVPDSTAHPALNTLLADHIVPEKRSRRTKHSEIMKCLHDRYLAAKRRVKYRRAYHCQRIVHMDNVDFVCPYELPYLAVSAEGIDRRKRKQELSEKPLFLQFTIRAVVGVDLMSVLLQKPLFIADHHILPSRDLIKIVYL